MRAAIEAAGGTSGLAGGQWIEKVGSQAAATASAGLVTELGVEAIRSTTRRGCPATSAACRARLQEVWVGRQVAEVKSKLQRMSPVEQETNITPCSVTWSRSRPIGAACWSRPAGTT